MKNNKLGINFLIGPTLMIPFGIFAFFPIKMLFNNEVVDENGEALGAMGYLMGALLAVIMLSWLISGISAYVFYFKHKGKAYEITSEGVCNTIVFTKILTFMWYSEVKLIPWSSVISYEKFEDIINLEINTDEIECGVMAKRALKRGYCFLCGYCKGKLSQEEIVAVEARLQGKLISDEDDEEVE